jgi:hypothetical protein
VMPRHGFIGLRIQFTYPESHDWDRWDQYAWAGEVCQ